MAQHCVLVSQNLPPELQYQGLMHDAVEAFLGDVTRPLKALLPDYRELERKIEANIFARIGLPPELDPRVKEADMRALLTEQRDLMSVQDEWACTAGLTPFTEPIVPWDPVTAKSNFLKCHQLLCQ